MDAREIGLRVAALHPKLAPIRVKSLYLFGSAARGEAKEGSDFDFLVEFEGPATFAQYMDLEELLEDEFNIPIDLVTVRALKPVLRDRIVSEAIRVA